MKDYHAIQMTGTACQGRNCAAASGAMAAYFGTRGGIVMTADEFRHRSGVSCIPGVDTPSGGLTVNAVERVLGTVGVPIDYGPGAALKSWSLAEIRNHLSTTFGAILLGMYSSVPSPWRAHGSTFRGGHSTWAHDLREDMAATGTATVQRTVCWHDPLRPRPIRVPESVVIAYTQTPSSLKGFAGFVRIPALPGGTYASPMTDRTRVRFDGAAVHSTRTKGAASTLYVLKPHGRLVELAMYAKGESYQGSTEWGALSLIGDEWVHVKRLSHVRGTT